MRRMTAAVFAIASLAATRCWAHAEYEPGRVPEATNAFTLHHGQTRLSLLGSSALGLGASTELTTYLAADLVLFFNLELKSAFVQTRSVQAAWMLGIGAGALPVVVGDIVPLPGAAVGVAGVGLAVASIQSGILYTSFRVTESFTFSVNAGGYAMEGTVKGLDGIAAYGSGNGDIKVAPFSFSGSRLGFTSGLELSETLGRRDALVLAGDVWLHRALLPNAPNGLVAPRAYWTHAFTHTHLSLGAYSMASIYSGPRPKGTGPQLPVGLYTNVFWTWR